MRSAFDHPHGCGKQPPCRRAATQPPHATWRAAFGGRLQLTASVLAAQERRWRKGWLSLPPLPVVLVVDTLTAALKAGRPEGRRQRAARPAWGDLPAGSARWPEMARARARLAGEVAVAVLRARQARNCVPKPFHYFELVLLTPLRQPKLGPPPSQPCSSRRARRDRAHLAQAVILRLCELGSPRRPRSGSGRGAARAAGPSPPRGGELQLQQQALAALHHLSGLGSHRAPSLLRKRKSATEWAAGSNAGQGKHRRGGRGGGGEDGVDEIVNKRVAKDSGSKTRTDLVPRKGPASSPTPIWSRRTWKAAPSTSARARAR